MDFTTFLDKFDVDDEQHDGSFLAHCPAHNDNTPSLVISVVPDTSKPGTAYKTLLKCRAGCETNDVLQAAGLHMRDLFNTTNVDGVSIVKRTTEVAAPDRARILARAYLHARQLIDCRDPRIDDLLKRRFGIDRATLTVDDAFTLGLGFNDERLTVLTRTADGRGAFMQARALDNATGPRWKGDTGTWDKTGYVGTYDPERPTIICEGPSDALVVAADGRFNALAVRGSGNARHVAERATELTEATVYVAGDGDAPGREFNAAVARVLPHAKVMNVPDGADLASLFEADPTTFPALLDTLTTDARRETPSMTEPTGFSDIELAEFACASQFNGRVTYSPATGWRYFPAGGHHWVADEDGTAVARGVQRMLRGLMDTAPDEKTRTQLGSAAKRGNVVDTMKVLDETYDAGGWDTQEHLLAAPNGVIDLRTGELRPGSPDDRLTRSVKVNYDPDAKAPRWERFLEEIFAHDPELPAYVQRLLGYGLTGSNAEACFAVLVGEGSNGKSTLLTALREILGDHAATVPFDMFTTNGKRGGPDTEHLVGARLALASETNRTAVLDSAAIKNATGGEEINVNPKYRKPYSFTPQALILLATNYKPIIKEQDSGTWRRVKVLPFLQTFEKDPTLKDQLRAEYEGILAWLVRGAAAWYRNGLQDPQSVTEAIESYRDESDALAGFLPGVLVMDPTRWTSNADIWQAYREWADAEGADAFRMSATLNKALVERGKGAIVAKKKGGKRGLNGVVLASVLKEESLAASSPGVFQIAAERSKAATAAES